MPRGVTRVHVALAAVASAFSLAQALVGTGEALAFSLPVLLVLVPLLCGYFVGEDAIHRVVARRRSPVRRSRPVAIRPSLPRPRAAVVRGARLMAASLAVRPPPAPAL